MRQLRMPGMAACWSAWTETHRTQQITLEDGMAMLLQAEEDARRANRTARLVQNARFRYPACIEVHNPLQTHSVSGGSTEG